jgi:predicted AlkP superfamily pyrophosphatase or phosphodiesterase
MSQKLTVFVLIDALGWALIEKYDFLSDLLPYRRPLRTILGFSSGAIPTMLTGVPPAQSGHWNLFYYDPQGSPFSWLKYFRFLPTPLLDNRITRKLLKEMGRHWLGLGPLFECCVSPSILHLFNWVEKKNIYAPGGIDSAYSIFDELQEKHVPYRVYSYNDCTDEEIIRRAARDIRAGEARFLFLYLSEMDMFLHMHCRDEAQIEKRLEWYARRLRTLFELALKNNSDVTLTICSDHGMTPVRDHHDLMSEVETLDLRVPGDYVAVYDSTMARFWFFSERASQEIAALLNRSSCGRLVPDAELERLGVFFPDRRFGDVIFLLNPGYLLARSDFNGPQWMPLGMHGYHPDDRYSDAIFLSNREPALTPRTIADVHEFMREAVSDSVPV